MSARPKIINFRASSQLAQVLSETAEREGVSVSDVVRQAVEERVAKGAGLTVEQRAAIDPFTQLSAAARGSLQAQRDLANTATRLAFERDENGERPWDAEKCLREGLVFARLAAAQGDIGDQGLVIGMIALLAEVVGEDAAAEELGEAMARMSMLADLKGGGITAQAAGKVADSLVQMVDASDPEVVRLAKSYTSRIQDKVLAK